MNIEQMAREAGAHKIQRWLALGAGQDLVRLVPVHSGAGPDVFCKAQDVQGLLERFAALVRASALDEAAKAVRARYMGDNNREDAEVLQCESAIRALKDKP